METHLKQNGSCSLDSNYFMHQPAEQATPAGRFARMQAALSSCASRLRTAVLIERIKCRKGLTLVEMAIAMFLLSAIATAAVSVFIPTMDAQRQAKDIAEINTQLDNIATLIMDDIVSAMEIIGGPELPVKIITSHEVEYTMQDANLDNDDDERMVIFRNGVPLIGTGFYRNLQISAAILNDNGIVTLTLTLIRSDGITISRDYVAKPVGLTT